MVGGRKLFVLLIFIKFIILLLHETDVAEGKPYAHLYFLSTIEGVFSQFLQAKIMNSVAHAFNYKLMLRGVERSRHFKSQVTNLCTVFDFPDSIGCGEPKAAVLDACTPEFYRLPFANRTDACYYSKNYIGGARFLILNGHGEWSKTMRYSVNIPGVPMVLQKEHHAIAELIRVTLGIVDLARSPVTQPYTAVHWRRGDQLDSRCKSGEDTSVNCGTVEQLIERVKAASPAHSIVYVATNEDPSSAAHSQLAAAGMITYAYLAEHWHSDTLQRINSLQVMAVEAVLMKEADTFLGWGYSEVNDVIEFERMNSNQTFCLDQQGIKDLTWCSEFGLKTGFVGEYPVDFHPQVIEQLCRVDPKQC